MLKIYIFTFLKRPETLLQISLVILTAILLFGFGLIDEPAFKAKLKGKVNNCVFVIQKHNYGGNIVCTAKLEDNLIVHFKSIKMMQPGDEVVYAQYERPFTHMTSYVHLF